MDKELLITEIKDAFSGVTLEDGVSLNMCHYRDSGGSAKKYLELAKNDERNNWTAIVKENTLNKNWVTFSFTDGKGFCFYLPAYMVWALQNYETSDAFSIDEVIYALNPDKILLLYQKDIRSLLSIPQLKVAEKFLEFAAAQDCFDGKIAAENLRKIRNL